MIKDFVIAKNVKDAISKNSRGYSYYAGGTEISRLNSLVKETEFVSLKNCELAGIEKVSDVDMDGKNADFVKIGAMCTFQNAIESQIVPDYIKKSLRYCESIQKRFMATVAGNIAMLRDDSYIAPTLIASNAELEIAGKKKRMSIIDYGEKYSKDDRKKLLITAIYIPLVDRIVESHRNSITASSSSTLNIAISYDSKKENFIIAAAIKTYGIVRLYDVENYLADKDLKGFSDEDLDEFTKFVENIVHINLKNDLVYGSAKYKKYILAATARLIIEKIMEN